MKRMLINRIPAVLILLMMFSSCSKDNSVPLPSRTYTLSNYSSGDSLPAGTFTLQKLTGGNVSVSIQLNDNFRVPGVTLHAYLTTADTSSLIYATLGTVEGTSGAGRVTLLKTDGNNQPVSYDTLIGKTGYTVKVLNNSNVQAKGSIQ